MDLKESKARKELCFELRKKTGLGLMSAKECLIDNDWDIVKAEENHMKYKRSKIINTMSVYTEEDRKLDEARDSIRTAYKNIGEVIESDIENRVYDRTYMQRLEEMLPVLLKIRRKL